MARKLSYVRGKCKCLVNLQFKQHQRGRDRASESSSEREREGCIGTAAGQDRNKQRRRFISQVHTNSTCSQDLSLFRRFAFVFISLQHCFSSYYNFKSFYKYICPSPLLLLLPHLLVVVSKYLVCCLFLFCFDI